MTQQSDDLAAINTYIMGFDNTKLTPAALKLKDEWLKWYDGLSDWEKNFTSTIYDEARNRRNAFNLANAVTHAQVAQVQHVITTGVSTEQAQGKDDRRDSEGNFIVPPTPLIPKALQWAVAGVAAAGAVVFFYGAGQSVPAALLGRGKTSSAPKRDSTIDQFMRRFSR